MRYSSKRSPIWDETIANMISNPKYVDYLFYGHMIAQCKVIMDTKLPAPAGVAFKLDHYDLYINPNEFDKYPLEMRLGVLKHEMLHILNNHVARKQDRDHQLFNIATDCAINQFIDRNHLPEGAIYPDNFPSNNKIPKLLTAEQYYELIPKQYKSNNNQNSSDNQNSSNNQNSSGCQNDNQKQNNKQNQGQSQGRGQGKKLIDDHSTWQQSEGDAELQKDLTKGMIEKSIAQTQKSRGTIPSQVSEWLSLHSRKREVDWRKVLRRIAGNKRVGIKRTLTRPDRRLPKAEWIKGKTKNRMFTIAIISDVSGSVSNDALMSLWGEIKHICDVTQSDLYLVQVDAEASKPEKFSKKTKIVERKGCGGTYLTPGIQALKDARINYDCLVVTTDGYLSEEDVDNFASLNKKVIWLIEPEGSIMSNMQTGRMQVFKLKG